MNEQFIQKITIDWDQIDKNSYLRNIDAIKDLKELSFRKKEHLWLNHRMKKEFPRLIHI